MNTQKEFLEALEEELRFLKGQEINEILKHYRDKINTEIDYGTLEEKVIKNLPDPKDIAHDIYKTRGISYLEIQKKKYRRKEIAKAVFSGIIIALMVMLFVASTIYVGSASIKIASLTGYIFSFKSILDILITLLIIVFLELTIVVLYIFLIDLFYVIISSFLTSILKAIKKTYKPHYKFQDFTINGFFKNKLKGKNILLILLLSFIGTTFVLSGVSAITIHGRTREEYYSGKVDLNIIKKVKESVNIPVIGNGDITDEESALKMFEYTGVDGIMIGRGAMGNPWIFEQIEYYLKTGEKFQKPTNQQKYEILKKHIQLDIKEKGEVIALNEMRKHISWYTKNMKDSSTFRDQINHTNNKERLMELIEKYFKENN